MATDMYPAAVVVVVDLVVAVVVVHDDGLAMSDHNLLTATIPTSVSVCYAKSIGRVVWTPSDAWDAALSSVAAVTHTLSDAIYQAEVTIACKGRDNVPRSWRRFCLDTAAWARDVVYVCAGHFARLIVVKAPPRPQKGVVPPVGLPASYHSYQEYKEAVAKATCAAQASASSKYMHLVATD